MCDRERKIIVIGKISYELTLLVVRLAACCDLLTMLKHVGSHVTQLLE